MIDSDSDNEFVDDDFPEEKSKSQIKREMQALHELGVAISKLTAEQQAKIPMPDSLQQAVKQAPTIKSNSAKKRHMQFIAKLIRGSDSEEIVAAYEQIQEDAHRLTKQHHMIEHWRDRLLAEDSAFKDFLTTFPNADRQQLRQCIRQAQKEAELGKPPASARKLFKLIRDTVGS